MAHNNIEVEIKTALAKKQFEDVRRKLDRLSKFIKTSRHTDSYYTPKNKNFLKPKYPYEWLSVRIRDNKAMLNYKHWYPEGKKHTTHCDEYETEIASVEQLNRILKTLDIKKFISVVKKRLVYIYNEEIEIALDEVKDLGYFIEAESLKDFGGIKKTYKKLYDFLVSLGIKKIEVVPGGYAAELMRRKGLITS